MDPAGEPPACRVHPTPETALLAMGMIHIGVLALWVTERVDAGRSSVSARPISDWRTATAAATDLPSGEESITE